MGSGAAEVQYRIVKILEESVGRKSGLSDPDYARTVVARIRDLEAEVDSLKKERVNYASSVAHAKLGLEAEIERLRDQLEAQCGLTAQIGNAEFLAREKNDVLVSELAKISKWNEKHQAEIERLSEELDVAHNTISAWVKSGSRMNAVIDELNVAQLEMATLANSRWAEIERLQATLKDQQLWLDAKTDETQNLSSEVKSLRAEVERLREENTLAHQDTKDACAAVLGLEARLAVAVEPGSEDARCIIEGLKPCYTDGYDEAAAVIARLKEGSDGH